MRHWTIRAIAMMLVALSISPSACEDQVVGRFDPDPLNTQGGSTPTDGPAVDSTSASDDRGEPGTPEICDGLDNDLDGLVDEVAAGSTRCNDCTLLQGVGRAWWVCDVQKPWADAQIYCQTLGAHAAIVPDEATQAFLLEQIGEGRFWLGARQDPEEGPWRWVDDTRWTYDNWGATQPDDA
ncbi:MAG: C-type lectin domain-containing protein [Myxococcota bacterium]